MKTSPLYQEVLDRARAHLGYRARPNRISTYGETMRQNGSAWDGTFLSVVLRETGVTAGVSLTSTTTALAYFTRTSQLHYRPRLGDIAFFSFSEDSPFGQPHVGLVTDTRDWKTLGTVTVIEGMTDSGNPRGPEEHDGVYERVRMATDIMIFARPKYRRTTPTPSTTDSPFIPSAYNIGRKSAGMVLIQLALGEVVNLRGASRGIYDSHTVSAVKRFQGENGLLPATGIVNTPTLHRLAWLTANKFFQIRS